MVNWRQLVPAVIALTLVAVAVPALAQTKGAEQQVLQAEKDRFAAMLKPDAAALEKLLSDDVTYGHGDGRVQTKAEFIKDLTSGSFDYVTITPDEKEWKVRVFGNTAVVTGAAAMHV